MVGPGAALRESQKLPRVRRGSDPGLVTECGMLAPCAAVDPSRTLALSHRVRPQELRMTKPIRRLVHLSALALVAGATLAQVDAFAPVRLAPEELTWTKRDNGTFRAGVAGDDQRPGMYSYRARFPANHRVEPHFHPDNRTVVVISGTLYVGFGERFDEREMKALPAGSTWTEPMRQPHFAWAKDGEVAIQIVGVGPSASTPVARRNE
jgi:hypothetical protein